MTVKEELQEYISISVTTDIEMIDLLVQYGKYFGGYAKRDLMSKAV